MRVSMFCHSLRSDWNHAHAHFLRGLASELQSLGHEVTVWEPRDAWSAVGLVAHEGEASLERWRGVYPALRPRVYELDRLDLEAELDSADLVLVHEQNDPRLVARVGWARAAGGRFKLLFHDTHHRSVTDPSSMARYDLSHYDGVLAFGRIIRDLYLRRGWTRRAWNLHAAADVRIFKPLPGEKTGDVCFVGNWGDDERGPELRRYLVEPIRSLRLSATVHGVGYPETMRAELRAAGIDQAGWLPNFEVPKAFARHRVTIHVPRRPYVRALRGVATIRPFEALACGIPLVCGPWHDVEGLFRAGVDHLVARDGRDMVRQLRMLLHEPERAAELALRGRETILSRHTIAHRVDELMAVAAEIEAPHAPGPMATEELA